MAGSTSCRPRWTGYRSRSRSSPSERCVAARHPDRCYRVVWGAAGASASINFSYEYGQSGNLLAGGYVGLLSVLGMVMFHEFLSQFEDGTDNRIRRENPKFGLRWLTWPSNTLLAAIAWRNHPPAEGTPGTVPAAVANLNRVRETKRAARVDVAGPCRAAGQSHPGAGSCACCATWARPAPTGRGSASRSSASRTSAPTLERRRSGWRRGTSSHHRIDRAGMGGVLGAHVRRRGTPVRAADR